MMIRTTAALAAALILTGCGGAEPEPPEVAPVSVASQTAGQPEGEVSEAADTMAAAAEAYEAAALRHDPAIGWTPRTFAYIDWIGTAGSEFRSACGRTQEDLRMFASDLAEVTWPDDAADAVAAVSEAAVEVADYLGGCYTDHAGRARAWARDLRDVLTALGDVSDAARAALGLDPAVDSIL